MAFKTPPLTTTEAKEVRRVGFEIEFTGLTIGNVTQILQRVFGGELEKKSTVEYVLHTPEYGKFKVELDWEFLKNTALDAKVKDDGHEWVDFLHQLASSVVPLEVVSPPIPLDKLEKLDELIPVLRKAGAKGTDDSAVAAFGVHINPELPALDVHTIHRYLQSFGLLQWWLNEAHDVNLTRKISPYIQLYSEEYVELLLSKTYQDRSVLIDDYLTHNPSRNRALDMLPLFAFIDEEKVNKAVKDSKVNQRPTFHYRLPDCLIENTNWSFATSWNIWYLVEALAADTEALDFLSGRFKEMSLPLIGVKRNDWVKEVSQWIKNRELG
ncbi:amidoligase family protein [Vibrio sp. J1-1]|uniref:amidoligase family protein n=1 Tax=Vibrio sp. J1-1 TaxID=2912251 RepID=UPI001F393DB0|nr:amidoligase family protein [Vibrio sp. J1-1]MCF7480890.1 amidoligase family protein [Vibrio sp. J1-1]